jgi:hypothetical protein
MTAETVAMSFPVTRTAGSSPRPTPSITTTGVLRATLRLVGDEGEMAMLPTTDASDVEVEELDAEAGYELFDRRVRELLGVDAAEFLRTYDADLAWSTYSQDAVSELVILIPFAR